MNRTYILYNPFAGNNTCKKHAEALHQRFPTAVMSDLTKLDSYETFFAALDSSDTVILCGGDGTINRFANETQGIDFPCKILYFPAGTGNDFALDLGHKSDGMLLSISDCLKNLPTVTVGNKTSYFLNGIGYGIDGYCCDVGDRMRETGEKTINYTAIAIKGLLFHYVPTDATVTVDGVTHTYKNVWLAPTMFGRFYGGGMMPTPTQDRLSPDKTLTLMVLHGSGKIKTLTVFPSIFKGEHVKHTEMVDILQGKEITVRFDRPTALQIDGETVLGVTEYSAHSAA